MSKPRFISNQAFRTDFPDNKVGITFIVNNGSYEISRILAKIRTFETYAINVSEHKKKRTDSQNKLLWGLISKTAQVENAKTNTIYAKILEKSQIKRTIILAEASEYDNLLNNFKAITDNQKHHEINGKVFNEYTVYYGSSNFNTKEMSQLIDFTKDYATKIGITDLELRSIEREYGI